MFHWNSPDYSVLYKGNFLYKITILLDLNCNFYIKLSYMYERCKDMVYIPILNRKLKKYYTTKLIWIQYLHSQMLMVCSHLYHCIFIRPQQYLWSYYGIYLLAFQQTSLCATRCVSCKKREPLTVREHIRSPRLFGVAHQFDLAVSAKKMSKC
jgi:hypothetical protein